MTVEVYLDTAATSRWKPECVHEAMARFMREVGASPGRSAHEPGIRASRVVADAREKVADLLGVGDSARVVFTLNCTEALNLAIKGILQHGDHVAVTGIEHNSVMRPLSAMTKERGVAVTRAEASPDGTTDPDAVRQAIRPETALIVMTHASNVTGAIQPVEECGRIAREHGVPFLVDAAQTAGCIPINLGRLPIDMMAFSGHKGLMGPQGVGGLYVREGIDLAPLKQGGTGSASGSEDQPEMLPDKYESGTPNTPGLAGLSAALDFIASVTVEEIRSHMCRIGRALLEGLAANGGLILYGPRDVERNVGVFSFTVGGRDPAEAAAELERRYGIMTRVGLHCAPSAHRAIGTFPAGTIRASIGYDTTREEAEYFLRSLAEMCRG
ncbi:MAG: aminotransferase class V-fold PLP-dependent enzyme [Planctomycetota bacterium]